MLNVFLLIMLITKNQGKMNMMLNFCILIFFKYCNEHFENWTIGFIFFRRTYTYEEKGLLAIKLYMVMI